MQGMFPIIENPRGSNRSPELDAICDHFGIPRGSYWCAALAAKVWEESDAEIPPEPASCESWRQWAFRTGRFSSRPGLGFATLYGKDGAAPAEHMSVCVVAVPPSSPYVYDIQGNTSEAGYGRNGELTELKRVDLERLIGYVSPLPLSNIA